MSEIAQYGEAVLRSPASPVTEFTPELESLSQRMTEIVERVQGLGLAAPQLRVPKQLIVVRLNSGALQALINPGLCNLSEAADTRFESCLSLPQLLTLPVERALEATVKAQDIHGQDIELKLQARAARVVQHEWDHLQGILILDRVSKEERRQALKALRAAHLQDNLNRGL